MPIDPHNQRPVSVQRHPCSRDGFTLLEVMVALAILGLALTAILSAQAGLYAQNIQARNLTHATAAARCKMNEVEEQLVREGLPFLDKKDEGPCCGGESPKGMRCRWAILPIVLPQLPMGGGFGGDAGVGGDKNKKSGGLDLTSVLGSGPTGLLGNAGNMSDLAKTVTGFGSANSNPSELGGITSMALTMVYPQLKPMLEASIRRITVTVAWDEGSRERTLDVVQFVTQPQKGLPPIGSASAGALPGGLGGIPGLPGGGGLGGGLGGLPMGLPGGR